MLVLKEELNIKSLLNSAKDTTHSIGNFVITGNFESYKRSELEDMIESVGGTVQSQVNHKTDYLLAGSKAGSKLKKAHSLNKRVITIEEFLSFISQSGK